jgi:hypothetical protein
VKRKKKISIGRTAMGTGLPLGIDEQMRIVRKDDPQPSVKLFKDYAPHSVNYGIRANSTFDIVVGYSVKVFR